MSLYATAEVGGPRVFRRATDEQTVNQTVRLSRYLAFLLRHKPETLNLTIDNQGWTPLDDLLVRLNKTGRFGEAVTRAHIEELVRQDRRRRFSIRDGAIRANGGHTTSKVNVEYPVVRPPDLLFFGTSSKRRADIARDCGLKPHKWRYIQLSAAPRSAERVASRVGKQPHVVVVEAARAARSGVFFYRAPSGVYLAKFIPFEFLLSEQSNYLRQESSGGVLYRGEGERSQVLLIRAERHGRGVWEIAKGKVEPGETIEEAAIRELCEETGVSAAPSSLSIRAPLRRIRYAFRTDDLCFLKTVHFFLIKCQETELSFQPRAEERIFDCKWFGLDEAANKVAFRNLRPIIRAAKAILHPAGVRASRRRRRKPVRR